MRGATPSGRRGNRARRDRAHRPRRSSPPRAPPLRPRRRRFRRVTARRARTPRARPSATLRAARRDREPTARASRDHPRRRVPPVPEIPARVPCRRLGLRVPLRVGRARDRRAGARESSRRTTARNTCHRPAPGGPSSRAGAPRRAAVDAHLDAGDRALPRERHADHLLRPDRTRLALAPAAR